MSDVLSENMLARSVCASKRQSLIRHVLIFILPLLFLKFVIWLKFDKPTKALVLNAGKKCHNLAVVDVRYLCCFMPDDNAIM